MEWWFALLLILGSFMVFLMTGIPIAFAFTITNIIGVIIFWGGHAGLEQLILSIYKSVCTFTYLPVPLFILLGEILSESGAAPRMIEAVDMWVGRLPGRLCLLSVMSGTLLGACTGSGFASTAVIGSTLLPEMTKRGYKNTLSMGAIMGSGGLAMLIPPSILAVVIAGLSEVSVGKMLIGGIVPGLMLAFFYICYIIIKCWLKPSEAPPYFAPPTPIFKKVLYLLKGLLPLLLIIFLVIGTILLGIATPSESAAMGALGAVILAIFYRELNWNMLKKCLWNAMNINVMTLMILTGSAAFSQLLAFSGAGAGLCGFVTNLPLPSIGLVIITQVIVIVMGTFMGSISMMMIFIPIFNPIVHSMGWDPLWFGLLLLINVQISELSPPFGMILFVMKGVAPAGSTIGDVYKAAMPYVMMGLIVLGLCLAFPKLVLMLPGVASY